MKTFGNIRVENSTIAIILSVIIAMACISYCTPASAQTIKREGNVFSVVREGGATKSIETKTMFTTKDGKMYTIFLSKNGHAYINRVSAKTGKEYKQYLPEEISIALCKEYKIEYKPSAKRNSSKAQ